MSKTAPIVSTAAAADSTAEAATPASGGRSLWLWVTAGFLFLAVLWGAMFFFAGKANVQSVPLATPGAAKP